VLVLAACAGGSESTTTLATVLTTAPDPPPGVSGAPGAARLREVLWVADTRIEADVSSTLDVTGLEVVIRFKDDGTVGGFAGCNTYRGPYELEGNRASVNGLAGTLVGCSGAKGELEQFVLGVVSDLGGFTYEITGDRLTIETDDGRGLGFTRSDEAAGNS
jgi:heat shock protein HslJ